MSNVPYPATRVYLWAHEKKVYSAAKARLLFVRMRAGGQGVCTPERTATYERMVALIEYLRDERGVYTFPGPKLLDMLIKVADQCGWYSTHASAALSDRPEEQPDGTYKCMRCARCFPLEAFQRGYTKEEQERYRSRPHAREPKKVATKHCAMCRHSKDVAQAARVKRRDARVRAQQVRSGRMSSDYNKRMSLVLEFYRDELKRETAAANRAGEHGYASVKQRLLRCATLQLHQLYDSGQLHTLVGPDPDWHKLLTDEQRDELENAYGIHVKAQTKGPTIKR